MTAIIADSLRGIEAINVARRQTNCIASGKVRYPAICAPTI